MTLLQFRDVRHSGCSSNLLAGKEKWAFGGGSECNYYRYVVEVSSGPKSNRASQSTFKAIKTFRSRLSSSLAG